MVFCNKDVVDSDNVKHAVTILILIDGFLQYDGSIIDNDGVECHNPYFNRWFSAIIKTRF